MACETCLPPFGKHEEFIPPFAFWKIQQCWCFCIQKCIFTFNRSVAVGFHKSISVLILIAEDSGFLFMLFNNFYYFLFVIFNNAFYFSPFSLAVELVWKLRVLPKFMYGICLNFMIISLWKVLIEIVDQCGTWYDFPYLFPVSGLSKKFVCFNSWASNWSLPARPSKCSDNRLLWQRKKSGNYYRDNCFGP